MNYRVALLFPLIALLAGCPESSSSTDASSTDTAVDASADTGTDTGTDTGSDTATPDVSADVGFDARPDTGTPDAPADTSADVASDVGFDARPDTGTPDASADTGTPDVTPTDVAVDAQPGDGGCARPDVAVLPSRTSCAGGVACPTGYECMSFSGVVLQLFCGRACRSDCDCPETQVCGSYSDKAGTHPLCVAR
ncbi:MAG: hypothetical protein U0326_44585 [Polyangiales bacterium]